MRAFPSKRLTKKCGFVLLQPMRWSQQSRCAGAPERVLANLIGNAIKHTERGGVWIGYRRARGRIEVRDCGIGIAAVHHVRLFDEFFQVENAARDRAKGLGLSLSIVQRFGALLSHVVSFASAPLRGSTFWTSANAHGGDVSALIAAANAETPHVAPPFALSLEGALLWVLEKDRDVAQSLAEFLRDAGAR
jgi:hypothetical protein